MCTQTLLIRQQKNTLNSNLNCLNKLPTVVTNIKDVYSKQTFFVGFFGCRNFLMRINMEIYSKDIKISLWHTTTKTLLSLLHENSRLKRSKLIRGLQVKCAGFIMSEIALLNVNHEIIILLDDAIKGSLRYVNLFKEAFTINPGCPPYGVRSSFSKVLLLSVNKNDGRKTPRFSFLKRRLTKRIVAKHQRRSHIF